MRTKKKKEEEKERKKMNKLINLKEERICTFRPVNIRDVIYLLTYLLTYSWS
jgi:hypothetical protein